MLKSKIRRVKQSPLSSSRHFCRLRTLHFNGIGKKFRIYNNEPKIEQIFKKFEGWIGGKIKKPLRNTVSLKGLYYTENYAPGVSTDFAPLDTPDIRNVSRLNQKIRNQWKIDGQSYLFSDLELRFGPCVWSEKIIFCAVWTIQGWFSMQNRILNGVIEMSFAF